MFAQSYSIAIFSGYLHLMWDEVVGCNRPLKVALTYKVVGLTHY